MRESPPAETAETAVLREYGYTDEQIGFMSPAQRAKEYQDAIESGVDPNSPGPPTRLVAKPTAVEDCPPPDLHGELRSAYAQISDLKQRNQHHRELWSVAAVVTITAVLGYLTTPSRVARDPWDGANRCQTLDFMRDAARANLEDEAEKDPKIELVFKSLDEAIAPCTAEDFRVFRDE